MKQLVEGLYSLFSGNDDDSEVRNTTPYSKKVEVVLVYIAIAMMSTLMLCIFSF